MATRKKLPPAPQAAFTFPTLTVKACPEVRPDTIVALAPPAPPIVANAPITPTSLPVVVDEGRKLRIVPPPDITPDEDVVVEPEGNRFAVSLIRHHGGSVATVIYTRKQLEMLLARIPPALEI